MSDATLSQVQGCLLGLQIGNARGIAWERKTPEWIAEKLRGKPLPDFADVKKLRKQKPYAKFEPGMTDDDWQHTRALGYSLVERRGFDLMDIARKLAEEYDHSTVGWGGSSRRNMKEIALFFRSGGKEGRDPRMPAKPTRAAKGTGNGVAMKIPALAIHSHLTREDDIRAELSRVWQIGQITHADPRASIAAYALMAIVCELMNEVGHDVVTDGSAPILRTAIVGVRFFEGRHAPQFGGDDRVSARLERLLKGSLLADPVRLRNEIGTSSFALESVPFAIATFLRHPSDFHAAIDEAILAGGDTDTNAAMVGALVGAYAGLEAIPEKWRTFRPEFTQAFDLGEQMCKTFRS